MSSPAPSQAGAGLPKKKLEPIPFKFCPECSNMLYPKEDVSRRKLMWVCRTCQYSEDATSTCVYRNILNNSAGETAGVTQDVTSDPTVCSATHSHRTEPWLTRFPVCSSHGLMSRALSANIPSASRSSHSSETP